MQDAIERYGSVDWATQGHAACIVDDQAKIVEQFEVAHTAVGLQALVHHFTRAAVKRVAIERSDGPVVEALRSAGLEVVVVSSRAIKALRTRYGLAGNKADRTDAYVLADCLRSDGQRWAAWQPDQPQTQALRATVRARGHLVGTRVAVANQLRAHLQIVFPGAVGLFSALDSSIGLRFLERFPSSAKAAWLTERRLSAWLHGNAYSGRTPPAQLWQRLHGAPAGPAAEAQAVIHAQPGPGAAQPARTDRHARAAPARSARQPSGWTYLPEPAACWPCARGDAASRDWRLPGAVPHAAGAGQPGGRGAVHPKFGQAPCGALPLEL
jgi:hypothetical protein